MEMCYFQANGTGCFRQKVLEGWRVPGVTSINDHETRQLWLIPSNKSCDGADNCGAIIGAGGKGEFFEV